MAASIFAEVGTTVVGAGEPGQLTLIPDQDEPALLALSATDGTISKGQWLAAFPSTAPFGSSGALVSALVVDGVGNATTAGYYAGQQTPAPGSRAMTSATTPPFPDYDPYIVRSNLAGGTVPFATHGDAPVAGSAHFNSPRALAETVNGGTFAVLNVTDPNLVWGLGSSAPETFDSSAAIYFVWLDATGVPTSSARNVLSADIVSSFMSVHADARGSVYLSFDYTGAWTLFADSATPLPLPSPSPTRLATALIKLTSDHQLAWVRTVESGGHGAGIALEPDGTPVLALQGSGTVTFAKSDGTVLKTVSAPGDQGLVARFDGDGNLAWVTVLGDNMLLADGSNMSGVSEPVIDAAGNIFVPAEMETLPAVLALDGKTLTLPASLGSLPQFLEKLSPAGARLDARVFGANIGPNNLSISTSGRLAMTTSPTGSPIYVGSKSGFITAPTCTSCALVYVFPSF